MAHMFVLTTGTLNSNVCGKKIPNSHFVHQTMALRYGFRYMIDMRPC